MPDSKISDFTDASPIQDGDIVPIVRGGDNFKGALGSMAGKSEEDYVPAGGLIASDVSYDNTGSGLASTTVQDALDEVSESLISDPERAKLAALQIEDGTIQMSSLGFGPTESKADNAAALLAALTACKNLNSGAGGGKINVDVTTDVLTDPVAITGLNRFKMTAAPGFRLIGQIPATPGNQILFNIGGTSGSATTMVGSVVKGATIINVVSAAAFSVGQRIFIKSGSNATGEYFSGVTGVSGFGRVSKEEANYVKSINVNEIELRRPLVDSYDAVAFSVSVTPINTIRNIEICGFGILNDMPDDPSLTNGNGQVGLRIDYCDDVKIKDMNYWHWQNAAEVMSSCWGVRSHGGEIIGRDGVMPDDCYYGKQSFRSYYEDYSAFTTRYARRGADTNALGISRYVTQRNLITEYCNGSGWGTHMAQFYKAHDNYTRNCNAMCGLRGKDMLSYNNDGEGTFQVGGSNGSGSDLPSSGIVRIINDTIRAPNDAGSSGVYIQGSFDELTVKLNSIKNCSASPIYMLGREKRNITIDSNNIDMVAGFAEDVNTSGVRIQNTSSTQTMLENVKVTNNTINGLNRGDLVNIMSTTGASKANHIVIAGNTGTGNHRLQCRLSGSNFGGDVTISEETFAAGAISGLRNRLLNGTFAVSERSGVGGATVTGGAAYAIDRFLLTCTGSGSLNFRQQINATQFPEAGADNYLQGRVITQAAPAAGDEYHLQSILEGADIGDFLLGTSQAGYITIGFWSRFSAAGLYSGAIQNSARNRSYVFEFTVVSAFSPRFHIVQIPLDQTGTWLKAEATAGMRVFFDLGSGTNFNAPVVSMVEQLNTWVAGNYLRSAASAYFVNTAANQQYNICAARLNAGGLIGKLMEPVPLALQKKLCQRYYQKRVVSVPAAPVFASLPIDMCAVPTVTGAGSGVATTGTTAGMLLIQQTTQATQTLELTAEIA